MLGNGPDVGEMLGNEPCVGKCSAREAEEDKKGCLWNTEMAGKQWNN